MLLGRLDKVSDVYVYKFDLCSFWERPSLNHTYQINAETDRQDKLYDSVYGGFGCVKIQVSW